MRCRPVFRCIIMAAEMFGQVQRSLQYASRPECAAVPQPSSYDADDARHSSSKERLADSLML